MTAVLRDEETGLFHRRTDRLILREGVYDNVPIEPTDVVLDLGAHIGSASRLFLEKGAKRAICVEADPDNIPLLRRNLRARRAVLLWAAVAAKAGTVDFYVRADRRYVGSTIPDAGRKRVKVSTVPFAGLLKEYRPTVVKCDIEFGEYGLPWTLPDHVRVIAMEVHVRYAGIFNRQITTDELRENRERASDFMDAIVAQGFREHWRKDKQAKPGEPRAEGDRSALGPMTKCVCVTWVR